MTMNKLLIAYSANYNLSFMSVNHHSIGGWFIEVNNLRQATREVSFGG